MALYIIAIGGTGAKCVEAVVHLAAAGLYTQDPIRVLFVDPDEANGNVSRARETLDIYQQCYRLLLGDKQQCPWMKTPIESLGVWSPFGDNPNKTLGSFFNYNNYKQNNPTLGHLFDVLYTQSERETTLDVGFRGRPAIGSAIMSQVELDQLNQEPWGTLISQIEADMRGKSQIFLCGSIFGGTGASGFPTIGRLLHEKFERNGRDHIKLGGLLMLPYFQFSVPPNQDPDEIYARSEEFLLKTEAALRYYVKQSKLDIIYLLGDQDLSPVKQFSVGKNTQLNEPHFIELYAALAVRNFLFSSKSTTEKGKVVLISRSNPGIITWDDTSDREQVKPNLVQTTRFAFAWIVDILKEFDRARQVGTGRFQREAPWFIKFFRPASLFRRDQNLPEFTDSEQEDAKVIGKWCERYLSWLATIHYSHSSVDGIRLFRPNAFADSDGQLKKEIDNFSNLVADDTRDEDKRRRDTLQRLKEQLDPKIVNAPSTGTLGLAKALYVLCKL